MTTETIQTEAYVLEPAEGQIIENLGLRLLVPDGRRESPILALVCTNPGPGGPPLHTHADIDELYYVLEGRYRFKIFGRDYEGGPGTFAFAPRGTSHTFASVGPEEGRLLAIMLPGVAEFLYGISALQPPSANGQAMLDHFHAFQTTMDGPPLV
jgi:mannose-6-phosphate isomerase-like protein (cupin superfamily)